MIRITMFLTWKQSRGFAWCQHGEASPEGPRRGHTVGSLVQVTSGGSEGLGSSFLSNLWMRLLIQGPGLSGDPALFPISPFSLSPLLPPGSLQARTQPEK